ncbi:MAG: extracellular solute-binding protein [Nostoc sp.]|nr:extracellular solute-binding protein [Nostoc sp. 'Peltigera membranacea cyanobiont' 232]
MSLRSVTKQSQNLQLSASPCDCLSATRSCERPSSSLRDALAFAMTVILSWENKNWDAPTHSPIVYPIAVLKSSKNVDAAKDFVQLLLRNQAKTVFEK